MKKKELAEKVIKVLVEQLGVKKEEVKIEAVLEESPLNCDDMDLTEIIMAVETEFSIDVDEEEIDALYAVEDLINLVGKKV